MHNAGTVVDKAPGQGYTICVYNVNLGDYIFLPAVG